MKKYIIIFFVIIFSFVLVSCGISDKNITKNQVIYYNEVGKVGEDLPVTRIDAAVAISFIFDDIENINNMEKKAQFSDVDIESYEYNFVNYVFCKGIMVGEGEKFKPDEPLTIIQAQSLIDLINSENKTKIKMSDDIKNKAISYALWNSLIIDVAENMGCKEEELKIFDVSENKDIYYTDKGQFNFYSGSGNLFVGNTVKAIVRGNNILGFTEVLQNQIEFKNIFVKKESENTVSVNIFSRKKIFDYSINENICGDIVIKNNDIEIIPIEKYSDDKIKLVSDDYIETEKDGRINYDENFTVYRKDGVLSDKSELLCAENLCEIYMKEGKVCSVWFEKAEKPENMRVVLSDNNKDGYIQNEIVLRSKEGFKLLYGNNEKEFLPDERLIIDINNCGEYFSDNCRIYIKPLNGGTTSIETLTKAKALPKYRGTIEIEKRDSGFVIVNELPFEEYLYGVVPCEMPVSFGKVPLMVQAVTARSYGYNQFFLNRFSEYGANIDDTVNSQVYNNMGEYEESNEAVDETKNMFLTYENTVISANYFSTSFGFTANSGETWADSVTKEFPSNTQPYLVSTPQFENSEISSLENEDDFRKFLESDTETYDSSSPWYRWYVNMTGTELSQAVKKSSENLFKNSPAMMEYSSNGKDFEKGKVSNIGRIKNIEITKRGQGGNVMTIVIIGESGAIRVNGEYNIRKIIPPKSFVNGTDVILKCKNGMEFKNLSIMPSGFFTFDCEKDSNGFISSITFKGGGNGHGVGMSQNGVKGMAEKGFSFEDILVHYFKGSSVNTIE